MAADHGDRGVTLWQNVLQREERGLAVGLGNFDGVHRGHLSVIRSLVEGARRLDARPAVLVLDPHPRTVLDPGRPQKLLTTFDERGLLLTSLGVRDLYVLPFDAQAAQMTPSRFVEEILARHLSPRLVVVGPNHRFGHRAAGTVDDLARFGRELGFETIVCPPELEDGHVISASRIRGLLAEGEVKGAARLLGRPYGLRGAVVQGDRRGRTLGFPTANVVPPPEKVWPAFGVYAARVVLGRGGARPAVVNFGPRPTFDKRVLIEAHILDFDGDIYGEEIAVLFEAFLRTQVAFKGVEELVDQIGRDSRAARLALRVESP